MSAIEVRGICPLKGEIEIQGSKNAALPMMAAAVMHKGTTVIDNIPRIQDVFCMMGILESLGCTCVLDSRRLTIDAAGLSGTRVLKEDMKKMRSSVMLLGPLLARQQEAHISCPGGCMIGSRPIDLHLEALKQFGAEVEADEETGEITVRAAHLPGGRILFPYPSVGATENAIFAAVAAEGESILAGCAREPEISSLCHMLNQMGARILGIGTETLRITGGLPLHGCTVRVPGDRIVAGTYLIAAAAGRGQIGVTGICSDELLIPARLLRQAGAVVYREPDRIFLSSSRPLDWLRVKTGPYPGFPTDLQSQLLALLCVCQGGEIRETVFESRFKTALELQKMGAVIQVEQDTARVEGMRELTGCPVSACDLRGGAALVSAGLLARGVTVVEGAEYILRGYEDICRDLNSLGGKTRYLADER